MSLYSQLCTATQTTYSPLIRTLVFTTHTRTRGILLLVHAIEEAMQIDSKCTQTHYYKAIITIDSFVFYSMVMLSVWSKRAHFNTSPVPTRCAVKPHSISAFTKTPVFSRFFSLNGYDRLKTQEKNLFKLTNCFLAGFFWFLFFDDVCHVLSVMSARRELFTLAT